MLNIKMDNQKELYDYNYEDKVLKYKIFMMVELF